jgi:CRISPR/Cas system-associated exonuclease Cas4 (RecB family)
MVDKPLAHSHSAIKQYEICPKQYKMQRITREVMASFGEASIYGNRIHDQLDLRLKDHTVDPLPEESVKYEPIVAGIEAMPGVLTSEDEMTLNIDLKPTGWWDKDAWLRSKIDVLIKNKETAVVLDWKTGKHRPDFSQLELFAIQTFKHHPEITKVKSTFVWLKDMRMDHMTYTIADAPRLWNKLLSRIGRIEKSLKEDDWPAKPSGLCGWCPAKHLCEHGR